MVTVSFKLYIHENYNTICSASESINKTQRDKALNLPFFFRYKHITSPKNHLTPAQSESLPYRFRGNFAVVFVLIYRLREFPLSPVTNRFELMYQSKQLLQLFYKICPCLSLKHLQDLYRGCFFNR